MKVLKVKIDGKYIDDIKVDIHDTMGDAAWDAGVERTKFSRLMSGGEYCPDRFTRYSKIEY